jgi:hypothetical protein
MNSQSVWKCVPPAQSGLNISKDVDDEMSDKATEGRPEQLFQQNSCCVLLSVLLHKPSLGTAKKLLVHRF